MNVSNVVALTMDLPEYQLYRGEVGTIVECYPDEAYEVEFVAQDGYTYALLTLTNKQLMVLKQKNVHWDVAAEPVAF